MNAAPHAVFLSWVLIGLARVRTIQSPMGTSGSTLHGPRFERAKSNFEGMGSLQYVRLVVTENFRGALSHCA